MTRQDLSGNVESYPSNLSLDAFLKLESVYWVGSTDGARGPLRLFMTELEVRLSSSQHDSHTLKKRG